MTEIWPDILRRLESKLDPKELKTWFAPTRQIAFEEGSESPALTISVPNRIFAEWIESRHGDLLAREAEAAGLPGLAFHFEAASTAPPPLELAAGNVHRLRFINIGPAGLVRFAIYRDTSLASWRRLAKDGADLPPAQAVRVPSAQVLAVGETHDFEFKPSPGRYRLAAELRGKPLWARVLLVR